MSCVVAVEVVVYLNWKLVLVVCNDCASFCWFFFFVVAVRCIYQFVDVWIDYIWYVELGFALLIVLVFRILKNCRLDVISSGDGGTSVGKCSDLIALCTLRVMQYLLWIQILFL